MFGSAQHEIIDLASVHIIVFSLDLWKKEMPWVIKGINFDMFAMIYFFVHSLVCDFWSYAESDIHCIPLCVLNNEERVWCDSTSSPPPLRHAIIFIFVFLNMAF